MSDLDLARRLVACPRFRWMPGMRTVCGLRVVEVCYDGDLILWGRDCGVLDEGRRDYLPDLTDGATVGALKALVQQMLGHDGASVIVTVEFFPTQGYGVVQWWAPPIAWTSRDIGGHDHPTASAALVAALEAAP